MKILEKEKQFVQWLAILLAVLVAGLTLYHFLGIPFDKLLIGSAKTFTIFWLAAVASLFFITVFSFPSSEHRANKKHIRIFEKVGAEFISTFLANTQGQQNLNLLDRCKFALRTPAKEITRRNGSDLSSDERFVKLYRGYLNRALDFLVELELIKQTELDGVYREVFPSQEISNPPAEKG